MPPVFSVLIPTKGRPQFVRDAIASVFLQQGSERDYEVVVSNNGGGEATKRAVTPWVHDDRFAYMEPPAELSMPDHWEWASRLLKGEYVLILTDRMMLRQGALESLRKLIAARPQPQVISWPLACYSELSGATSNTYDEATGIIEYKARTVWESLKEGPYLPVTTPSRGLKQIAGKSIYDILARGLNSCVHRSIYDSIRAVRSRAFDVLTPDFSSAFSVLLVTDVIHHHPRPLTIQQGVRVSNGRLMKEGIDTGYMKPLGNLGQIRRVPLSQPQIPFTTAMIYEDFFRAADFFGYKLDWTDINPVAFYRACFSEVVARHAGLAPWNPLARRSRKLYRDAINGESSDRAERVRRGLRGSFRLRDFLTVAIYAWGSPHLLNFLRQAKVRMTGAVRYPTALEAAGFGQNAYSRMGKHPVAASQTSE